MRKKYEKEFETKNPFVIWAALVVAVPLILMIFLVIGFFVYSPFIALFYLIFGLR